MSNLLERQHRQFTGGAAIKAANTSAVLGPALQGTTTTMPTLSGTVPTTWKPGLSAPTEAKLDALWQAIGTLCAQIVAAGLHYHPATLSPTTGSFITNYDDIALLSYLKPANEELMRKDFQLARGVRLKNPAGAEVCGGSTMTGTEGGDPLAEAADVYEAEDFTGLLGSTAIEDDFTALSLITAQCLEALAGNSLLQTA